MASSNNSTPGFFKFFPDSRANIQGFPSSNHRPGFSMLFYSDKNTDKLKIPPSFLTSIRNPLPGEVVLKDQYNNVCRVKVEEVAGNGLCLTEGWPIFVKENSIREVDLMVFNYSSEGLFEIDMFDLYGSKTKGLGGQMVFDSSEEEEEIADARDDDKETDDNEVLEDDSDHDREQETRLITAAGTKQKQVRVRRVLPDIYGAEIFRAGLARRPLNPYFVTKINPRCKNEFYIPKSLISNNQGLHFPKVVVFIDPEERRWRAVRHVWKTGRMYYSKGWRNLCLCNLVNENDICICEFVQIGEDHCIKVKIIRALTLPHRLR